MDFEIIVDDRFVNILNGEELTLIDRKFILFLLNDFEDGAWRYSKFSNYIWDNIAETALSKNERDALINNSHSTLVESARKLRFSDSSNDPGEGSEIAEILLYGIMKDHFHALPVVPKIFYKQNSNDYAKGADSVHIVLNEEGNDFSLWFGEAKFYKSIEDRRLTRIINSVAELLTTEKLKKENSIITNIQDIEKLKIDEEVKRNIRDALKRNVSIDHIKSKINVPILLLHECPATASVDEISEEYILGIRNVLNERARNYFKKQIDQISASVFNYSLVTFHLILFPIPDKDLIVEKFLSNAHHYREQ